MQMEASIISACQEQFTLYHSIPISRGNGANRLTRPLLLPVNDPLRNRPPLCPELRLPLRQDLRRQSEPSESGVFIKPKIAGNRPPCVQHHKGDHHDKDRVHPLLPLPSSVTAPPPGAPIKAPSLRVSLVPVLLPVRYLSLSLPHILSRYWSRPELNR